MLEKTPGALPAPTRGSIVGIIGRSPARGEVPGVEVVAVEEVEEVEVEARGSDAWDGAHPTTA